MMSSSVAKRSLFLHGAGIQVLATSEETSGDYALIELTMPPGFLGAPPHYHKLMRESFYVLEGSVEFTRGEETIAAGPGDVIIIPPLTVHAFRNAGQQPSRVLEIATPAGHDRFFLELIDWMEREPQWPPADKSKLVEFGLRHDTYYS